MLTVHAAERLFFKGTWVDIDRNIIDVITALWALGIETMFSCEDNTPRDVPSLLEANLASHIPAKIRGKWFQVSMTVENAQAFIAVLGTNVMFSGTTYFDNVDQPYEYPCWSISVFPHFNEHYKWSFIVHFYIPYCAKAPLVKKLVDLRAKRGEGQ